jgi:hypothetical protein
MTARCYFTDLLAEECGCERCRPEVAKPRAVPDRATSPVVARFSARFDSDCDHCGIRMFEGDDICRLDNGDYVHDHCAPATPWET